MLGIGTYAVQDGVPLGALPHLGSDATMPEFFRGLAAMKAIREPVVIAVVEHDDRREGLAVRHGLGVVRDRVIINLGAGLRTAVNADARQR